MRLVGWRIPEMIEEYKETALKAARGVMDAVVEDAVNLAPKGTITREGKWQGTTIAFTPKTGRGKNKPVSFEAKVWLGRIPGTLKESIRVVEKQDRPYNLRVYAGHRKVGYARFVEKGVVHAEKQPYLRPAFNKYRGGVAVDIIQKAVWAEMTKWGP